jgi:hypothetical protein
MFYPWTLDFILGPVLCQKTMLGSMQWEKVLNLMVTTKQREREEGIEVQYSLQNYASDDINSLP